MVAMVLRTIILVKSQVPVRDSLRWEMGHSAQMACWEAQGCSATAAGIPLAMVCTICGDVWQLFDAAVLDSVHFTCPSPRFVFSADAFACIVLQV